MLRQTFTTVIALLLSHVFVAMLLFATHRRKRSTDAARAGQGAARQDADLEECHNIPQRATVCLWLAFSGSCCCVFVLIHSFFSCLDSVSVFIHGCPRFRLLDFVDKNHSVVWGFVRTRVGVGPGHVVDRHASPTTFITFLEFLVIVWLVAHVCCCLGFPDDLFWDCCGGMSLAIFGS